MSNLRRRRRVRKPEGFRAQVFALEARTLLSTAPNAFARIDGAADISSGQAITKVRMSPSDFDSLRDRILIGFSATALAGSPDPGPIGIVSRGRGVAMPVLSRSQDSSDLLLATVGHGPYALHVETPGAYRLYASLAGDANGDFRVNANDLRLIRSLQGVSTGDLRYRVGADVDGDGLIGGHDLALAKFNRGASTRIRPLATTIALASGTPRDASGRVTTGNVTLAGRGTPRASIGLDLNADGTIDRTTTADASGAYRFPVAAPLGVTRLLVIATDRFGQTATDRLTFERAGSNPTPTVAPTITITTPVPTAPVRTPFTIRGTITDPTSPVATLTVQVDGGAAVAVPFDAATGAFQYTPSVATDGTHAVVFAGTDAAGDKASPATVSFRLDATPPTATSSLSGTINTAISGLDVTFSEPIAGAAMSPSSYVLQLVSGAAQPGPSAAVTPSAVTFTAANVAHLTFASPLANGSYTLTLSPSITDLAGNPLAAATTSFPFTVAVPVQVVATSPSDGEENVSGARTIVVNFDAPVDPSTVTSESFHAIALGQPIAGTLRVSATKMFATLIPTNPLPASTEVRVTVDGDKVKGLDGLPIDGDGDGLPGGQLAADFTTLSLTRIPGTDVFGYVYDSYNKNPDGSNIPIVGATIRVDADPTLNAVTDSKGYFLLKDLPTPSIFVHVDGTTATPPGAGLGYPSVGKEFMDVPGQTIQLTMDGASDVNPDQPGDQFNVYLPPMSMGDLKPISTTEATTVGFGAAGKAELATLLPGVDPSVFDAVKVDYPAGSAIDRNGNPASMGAIIPVPPDRLPAPLPPGQDPKLVISIQALAADGTPLTNPSFDTPASVSFPNLEGLSPGEKSLIWSFNHDKGMWEVVGTGTVSADGKVIVSDGGVIKAPGWHFTEPGTEPKPPEPKDKPKDCDPTKTSDIVEDIWALSKSAFDCVRNMTQALQVIGTVLDQVDAIKTITQKAIKLGEDIKAGKSYSAISDGLAIIEAEKDKTVSLYEAATGVNPVSKAIDAAKCASGLASTIASRLCSDARKDCYGSIGQFLCDKVAPMVEFANKLVQKASELEKAIRDAPLLAVCLALNEVKNLLDAAGSGGKPPARGALRPVLSPDATEAILAKLDEAINLGGQFGDVFAPSLDSREVVQGALNLTGVIQDEGVSTLALDHAAYVNAYWKLTVGEAVLTGRTSSSGRFDLPVIAPNTPFEFDIYDLAHNTLSTVKGVSARSGFATIVAPQLTSDLTGSIDTDGDGLADNAEDVIGTSPSKADTNADGITDLAAIQQGLNPLGSFAFPTGEIANLALPGPAEAVAVANDFAYVATGGHGLAIVNGSKFNAPILQGQIDLGGSPSGVGVDPNLKIAAVATGQAVALVDVSDPMAPRLIQSLAIGADHVVVSGGLAYVAAGRFLRIVDLAGAEVVQTVFLPGTGNVTGLAKDGDVLYAYVSGSDLLVDVDVSREGAASIVGQLNVDVASGDVGLFVGGGVAWLSGSGLRTVNVSDPARPRVIHGADFTFTSRRLALNGSGLGLLIPDGGNLVQVYDTSDPRKTNQLLTQFNLSGAARSVAISRGIGYVGTSTGLEVINYEPFDSKGVAPTVSISAGPADADPASDGVQVLEGSTVPIQVAVDDDVQVRDVALIVDGVQVADAVDYPFDLAALAPTIASGATTLTVQVRATDTGGNSTLSNVLTYALTPDRTPPAIVSLDPADGSTRFQGQKTVRVAFSEPIDPAGASAANFQLVSAGPDGTLGTADDAEVGASLQLADSGRLVQLTTTAPLDPGLYVIRINRDAVTDRAGNKLGSGVLASAFTVVQFSASADFLPFGTDIFIHEDDTAVGIGAMPFDFDFFGAPVGGPMFVTSNGVIEFGTDFIGGEYTNFTLPHGSMIAAFPFFDDLYPPTGGEIGLYDSGGVRAITFRNLPYYSNNTKTASFQIAFLGDGSIQVRYGKVDPMPDGSATIGLSSGSSIAVPGPGSIANEPDVAITGPHGNLTADGLAKLLEAPGNNLLIFTPDGKGGYTITHDPIVQK